MFKHAKVIMTSIFAVVIFLSCGDDELTGPEPVIDELVPTRTGNFWWYTSTSYDPLGFVQVAIQSKISIVGDTTIRGTLWYKQEVLRYSNGSTTDTSLVRNDASGRFWLNSADSVELSVRFPVDQGDTYSYTRKVGTLVDTISVHVTSTSMQISVPAGYYKCIQYSEYNSRLIDQGIEDSAQFYYSPGIGLVAWNFYRTSNDNSYLYSRRVLDSLLIIGS